MGFTTVLEINHDFAHEIEREPDNFVAELLAHINAGKEIYDDIGVRVRGGFIISTFHRSNNDFDRIWNDYKRHLKDFLKYLADKSAEMKRKGFKF
jgi:hypothetical protein